MEPQKSAANRVRHILQAMERSIDNARSRRVGNSNLPASSPMHSNSAGLSPSQPAAHDRTMNHAGNGLNHASLQAHLAARNDAPAPATQMMIGAPAPAKPQPSQPATATPSTSPATAPGQQAPRGGQPPRLKAKPKRFDSNTFNSAFAPPPAYRSQAG